MLWLYSKNGKVEEVVAEIWMFKKTFAIKLYSELDLLFLPLSPTPGVCYRIEGYATIWLYSKYQRVLTSGWDLKVKKSFRLKWDSNADEGDNNIFLYFHTGKLKIILIKFIMIFVPYWVSIQIFILPGPWSPWFDFVQLCVYIDNQSESGEQ